ncbi:unnamed protein product [Caenorhabditis angaria]|uniref:15-oxoprostaglandin 13-reductase n=1 Tax=Caenorhabditis angaria TaxID=860376 RepID=A0A9P1IE32_9PELO|nr:unnamed protein product [Caenorhabditis angaria]
MAKILHQLCNVLTWFPRRNPKKITENQCIVRSLYLSVDPAQRCRMNISTGCDYLPEYQLNGQIDGLEGVGVVEKVGVASECNFAAGDLVVLNENSKNPGNFWPWAKYFVKDLEDLKKVDFLAPGASASLVLSYFGLSSGITAICGVWNKAQISSQIPQTLVISGAAGSCGTLVHWSWEVDQKLTKFWPKTKIGRILTKN